MRAVRALARFHRRAGARAALRASTIGLAVVIFALGSAPDAAYTFMTLVRGVVSVTPWPTTRYFLAAGAVALALTGARRITLGAGGWMRSLPISGRDARRAAWLGCVASTLPIALFAVGAIGLTVLVYRAPLSPARILGLAPMLLAAGALALPVERALARLAALGALLAAAEGSWLAVASAVALLAAWDAAAGALALPTRRGPSGRTSRQPTRLSPALAARALVLRFAWRATGVRALADALLLAALPMLFCHAIRAHNVDLAADTRAMLARLGLSLGAALAAASLTGPLLARRAPWPWVRTLPWRARDRVLLDACALLAAAVLAGTAGALAYAVGDVTALRALPVALAASIVAAAAGAAALPMGAARQTGAVGETALVGIAGAVGMALVPALALAAPVIAAALVALGARRDARHAGAVRWTELRHGTSGDPGWIARA